MQQNLWSLVEREPYNHYFWTELVRVAEESKSYEGIVRVYSQFLEKFPLLHIYWNKWALIVHQNSSSNSVRDSIEIFERAVQPGVLEASVEMWQCYCDFITKYNFDVTEDEVRQILNRAIATVGSDYQSDSIWSIYIHWEDEHQRFDNVSALYASVLSQPIRNLDTFFQNFTEHARSHSIERAASPHEKSYIDEQLNKEADNDVTLKADDLDRRQQELIYELRQTSYMQSMELLSQSQFFEVKIRRTYFHFTLPNPAQVANWYEYLGFAESRCAERTNEEVDRVKHLYERCLIPCNMCPDIWIKYSEFLYNLDRQNEAEELLSRAANGLVARDPEFLRMYGMVVEKYGNNEKANEIFEKLKESPKGAAKIGVAAFYIRRSSALAAENPQASEEFKRAAIDLLLNFLKITKEPREYALVAAYLAQMNCFSAFDELAEICLQVPLALSLRVNALVKQGNIEAARQSFEHFLASPASKMELDDKEQMYPIYIDFLRKYYQDPSVRRQAEKQYLEVQKLVRIKNIEQRREKCKDTSNLSEVMDRWILYLQETDDMMKGSQSANA